MSCSSNRPKATSRNRPPVLPRRPGARRRAGTKNSSPALASVVVPSTSITSPSSSTIHSSSRCSWRWRLSDSPAVTVMILTVEGSFSVYCRKLPQGRSSTSTSGRLPEPMRVWSWHLRQLDGRAPALPLSTRASFAVLDRATEATAARPLPGKARRLRHLLSEQRNVRIAPDRLLPVIDRTELDVVILTESHDDDAITVEPIDPLDVARRMAAMLPVERAPLLTAYQAFRYAFPDRRSDLLDRAEERERELLPRALGGIPALQVRHPYPFSFPAMADALAPWLDELRGR
jgi:hypothetical protein